MRSALIDGLLLDFVYCFTQQLTELCCMTFERKADSQIIQSEFSRLASVDTPRTLTQRPPLVRRCRTQCSSPLRFEPAIGGDGLFLSVCPSYCSSFFGLWVRGPIRLRRSSLLTVYCKRSPKSRISSDYISSLVVKELRLSRRRFAWANIAETQPVHRPSLL